MSERGLSVATGIDRFGGVEPGPGAVMDALVAHRDRTLSLFGGFDDQQWRTQSRCSEWTVHEVVRHLVDVANLESALLRGEGPRTPDGRIDPRADPADWLSASDGQTPDETVAAFEAAVEAERRALEQRIAENSDELLPGPYGPLHWAALGSHLFWDAWLHERDILFPLALPHDPTPAESRLAALYALTISSVAPTFFGSSVALAIELSGNAPGIYEVDSTAEATRVRFTGTTGSPDVRAELDVFLDALAGRGADLFDVVQAEPDAVKPLTVLRDFLLPTA